jgi:hypothetical protein
MNKIKTLATALAIIMMCALTAGQTPPPAYTLTAGLAEWTAPDGVALDTLWPAVVKCLMAMGYRIVTADKPSGILEVRVAKPAYVPSFIGKIGDDEMAAASVLFDTRGAGITLTIKFTPGIGAGDAYTPKKFYKEFFAKLEASLTPVESVK